jgi:predicted enzyme related to lactoylglutathione lyase
MEIGVSDSAAANKFYADLFDWKIDSSNPMNYGIVDPYGNVIGLVTM